MEIVRERHLNYLTIWYTIFLRKTLSVRAALPPRGNAQVGSFFFTVRSDHFLGAQFLSQYLGVLTISALIEFKVASKRSKIRKKKSRSSLLVEGRSAFHIGFQSH